MRKEMRIFALVALSTVVFTLFSGMVSAAPAPGGVTVTIYPGFNPELVPDGMYFLCNVENTGSKAVAKFQLTLIGGTLKHWYYQSGWTLTNTTTTATWQVDSNKWVIRKNDLEQFTIDWIVDAYATGFTGSWNAYDRKGNIIDSGTLSWHYP
jgi:hypothetical protein